MTNSEIILMPRAELKTLVLEALGEFYENHNTGLDKHDPAKENFEWIPNEEFCQKRKIHANTAMNWRRKGLVKYRKIGNKIYYPADGFERMKRGGNNGTNK